VSTPTPGRQGPHPERHQEPTRNSLEKQKLTLEVAELDQKLKYGRVTYWLSILGIAGALGGLALERYKTLDQRSWEQAEHQKQAKIARMTEIATEYDRLLGTTTAVLNESNKEAIDTLFLKQGLDAFDERLSTFRAPDKEVAAHAEELRKLLQTVKPRFEQLSTEGDIWRSAAELQETWQGRAQLTPDFPLLYGSELSGEWRKVAELARSALGKRFTLMGSKDQTLSVQFVAEGAALQEKLYVKIRELDVGKTGAAE
jgi:hypothetical protein